MAKATIDTTIKERFSSIELVGMENFAEMRNEFLLWIKEGDDEKELVGKRTIIK